MNRFTTALVALATTATLSACGPTAMEQMAMKDLDTFERYLGAEVSEGSEASWCAAMDYINGIVNSPDIYKPEPRVYERAKVLQSKIRPELVRRGFTPNEVNRLAANKRNSGGKYHWRMGDRMKYANCYEGETARVAHVSSYSDTMYQYGGFSTYGSPTYVWFGSHGSWPNSRITDWSS